MNLTIPIYVEGRKTPGTPTVYHGRPLFHPLPTGHHLKRPPQDSWIAEKKDEKKDDKKE